MYDLKFSKKFKKDLKKINKNNPLVIKKLEHTLYLLVNNKPLEEAHKNHKLHGDFNNCHECHIKPNVLLIYKKDKQNLIIYLSKIGSHPELFG